MVQVTSMLEEYGEEMTSVEVLRRARCAKCGFQGNNHMRLVYVGNSDLAQTRSAIKSDKLKEVEVYCYLLGTVK